MKIIVLPQSGYLFQHDNSAVSCSFVVLLAVCLGAAGSRCAQLKWGPIAVSFNCLLSWPCRYEAPKKSDLRHGVLDVVIDLSDSEDGTHAGERRKNTAYCQCEGEERWSRILPDGTKKLVQQVHGHVHGHCTSNYRSACKFTRNWFSLKQLTQAMQASAGKE